MLAGVTAPTLEIGSGASRLRRPAAADPRRGPLGAIALGTTALRSEGANGCAVVLATDLPLITQPLLEAISRWSAPTSVSVVPVAGGRPQYLCARWSAAALEAAVDLDAAGERRVQAALDASERLYLGPADLAGFDLDLELADVDDDEALRRLGLVLPAAGEEVRAADKSSHGVSRPAHRP